MPRQSGSFTRRPWLARLCYQQSPDRPGDRRTFEGIASHKHLCTAHRNGDPRSIATVQVLLASSGLTPCSSPPSPRKGRAIASSSLLRARDALSAHTAVGAPAKGLRDNLYGGRRSVMGCVDSTLGSAGPYRGGVCDPIPSSMLGIGSCAVRL